MAKRAPGSRQERKFRRGGERAEALKLSVQLQEQLGVKNCQVSLFAIASMQSQQALTYYSMGVEKYFPSK